MYSFFVLGIVPGTNIQISFQIWLNIAGLILVAWLIRRHWHSRDFEAITEHIRRPLDASSLHRRG